MKRSRGVLRSIFLALTVAVLFFQGESALADNFDLKVEPRESSITLMQVDPLSKIEWLARAPDDHPGEWTQARVNGVIGWIETSNLALNRNALPVADLGAAEQYGATRFAVDAGLCSSGGSVTALGTQTVGGATSSAGSSGSSDSSSLCGGIILPLPFGIGGDDVIRGGDNGLRGGDDVLRGGDGQDLLGSMRTHARFGVSDTSDTQTLKFQRDAFTGTLDSTVTYRRGTTFSATAGVEGNLFDFDCGGPGAPATCMVGWGAHAGVNVFDESVTTAFDQSCCGGGVTRQSSDRTTVQPVVGGSIFVSVPTGNSAIPHFDIIGRAEWSEGPDDFNFSTTDGFGNPITDRVSQKDDVSFGVTVRVPLSPDTLIGY